MHRVSLEALKPADLVFSNVLGSDQRYLLLSRLGGFSLALALALLTAPLMLIVALAIRLSSPGPVFYVQERVGLRGRRFRLYKFRSMRADAEQKTGAVWAAADDPRITPVGRWLRRFRIDELPQLLNVLRGEMAIVGPRPERPEFVQVLSREIPFYGHRHAIPPGITGWAQISHGYGDSIQDAVTKLEFDLYYLKNLSLSLDTYIVFHTLKVMLLRRGAQ
jgi:exopolysaccharide biosynthesis polyprenyl glycosylphosphotransferase